MKIGKRERRWLGATYHEKTVEPWTQGDADVCDRLCDKGLMQSNGVSTYELTAQGRQWFENRGLHREPRWKWYE